MTRTEVPEVRQDLADYERHTRGSSVITTRELHYYRFENEKLQTLTLNKYRFGYYR